MKVQDTDAYLFMISHACIFIAINCISVRFLFITNYRISIAFGVHGDSEENGLRE
jgi:hypothetical protein